MGEEPPRQGQRVVDQGLRHAMIVDVKETNAIAGVENLLGGALHRRRLPGAHAIEVDEGDLGLPSHSELISGVLVDQASRAPYEGIAHGTLICYLL